MNLVNILNKDLITLELKATSKESAFVEMLKLVKNHDSSLSPKTLLEAVKTREKQQSTLMGQGLAMPHARIDNLQDFIILVGRSKEGVSYDEGKDPVHVIVMFLSCKTKINMLLQTMGTFAGVFSESNIVEQLLKAYDAYSFLDVFEKNEIVVKQSPVARDLMNCNHATLSPNQTLKEALDIIFEKNISGAPVVDEDSRIIGVLTEKCLIGVGLPKYMSEMDNIAFLNEYEPFQKMFEKEDKILVKDICEKNFLTVHEQTAIIQLAFYFYNQNCRRVLVVDEDKKLVGIVMRKDLIRKVIHA